MANQPPRPGSTNFADRLKPGQQPQRPAQTTGAQTSTGQETKPTKEEQEKLDKQYREEYDRMRDRTGENTEAMRQISEGAGAPDKTKSPAGEQDTTATIISDISEHPDDQKIGNRMPSSTRVGADDSNPRVTSDVAAESSTLTRNQQDGVLGRGPSPQDQLPSQATQAAIDREIEVAKRSTGEEAEVRYFYSTYPNFGVMAGRRGTSRATFKGRVLATSDPEIIKHIEENYLDKGKQFRVKEISEDEYRKNREQGFEAPIITTLRDVRMMGQKRELVPAALQARAPRTDENPAVLEAETGNAQQDHFTQAALLIGQERPETSTGNVQLQRNEQTLNELKGGPPVRDNTADQPAPKK